MLKPAKLALTLVLAAAPAVGQSAAPAGNDPTAAAPGQRVVLVLPFDNRSGQPNLNWIGDSFPDTLNQRLSSVGFLTISRDDRFFALDHLGLPAGFHPTRATTIRIAQTLDAAYVIVGSYNVEGDKIQVQAQVLDVNALHLSTPLQDGSALARLFDAENAIAWKVAREVNPHFSVAEGTFLSASSGIKLTAFENYIRGISAPTSAERIKRLQAAVAESPAYAAAQLALGKELYTARDYDQSAAVLAKVAQNSRLSLEANFFLGLARFNAAKYAEAEAAFAFVASRLPLPEVVNDQAVAQSRQGKDGTVLFQRAVSTDPNDPDYHFNLAVALYRRADFANAVREVDSTVKLRPADPEAAELRKLIASGHVVTGKSGGSGFDPTARLRRAYSEAGFRQAAFELDQVRAMRLSSLAPAQRAAEYAQLGRDFLAQGLLPEAEQQFNSAIAADARSAVGHAGLAQVREQSGDDEAARSEAQASNAVAPNPAAFLVLARLDLKKNDLAASAADVGNALRLDPRNPAAQGMKSALSSRGQSVQ